MQVLLRDELVEGEGAGNEVEQSGGCNSERNWELFNQGTNILMNIKVAQKFAPMHQDKSSELSTVLQTQAIHRNLSLSED